ncbi:MAG: PEP-CTERM sorting domain-containing protein [Cyanobacteriota bacterium]|jgi:hypothetical protein
MFKLPSLTLGLLAAGLTLAVTPQAQAYQFNFLDGRQVGNAFDWRFEFVSEDAGDPVQNGDELRIEGFEGVTNASTTRPRSGSGLLDAREGFIATGFTATTASYTVAPDVNVNFPTPLRYQTFTVRATSVPTGIVQAFYNGQPLDPTVVPEPLTIIGSLAALGFGAYGQRQFNRRSQAEAEA